MTDEDRLQALRAKIDDLDRRIHVLINERARSAQQIAKMKHFSQGRADCYRPEREAEVLRNVLSRNEGPLGDEEIARLFREIMSACLALEQPMRVAFLGPEGTFTHAAALKHFGHSVTAVALPDIEEVFREVESGGASYGVVPVENSTEGVVDHTLDMFLHSTLQICGEVELRIHHHLLSTEHSLSEIRRVYAHQQTFAQCRRWLETHLPTVERVSVNSNAEGARQAVEKGGCAAIAGAHAQEIYRLGSVASNIEDEPDNTTRFLIIGKESALPSGNDKLSLLLSTPNQPGALHRLLQPFAKYGLSMTRIESRPSHRGLWDYVFFIDVEGHIQDSAVVAALEEVKSDGSMFKILGAYPQAVL